MEQTQTSELKVSKSKSNQDEIETLEREIEKLEKALVDGHKKKWPMAKLAQISKLISQRKFKIADLENEEESNDEEKKKQEEIKRLEEMIDQLYQERVAIDGKLATLEERLRALRPYDPAQDTQNRPETIPSLDEHDDMERLGEHMRNRHALYREMYGVEP